MEEENRAEGMLSPYRVLDLTDEKGLMCGKLLGDLGADVIKIEKPGGDPARQIGPFYHDQADPEKSLFWWAFNTSKRGITLDIETADGQETFKKLVQGADFVIESFPPGYLDGLGLGYSALEEINPGIILVSITPFGQTGPYKDYQAPDIVAWAMGGAMYEYGDADRPPIHISHHSQAHLHAAGEAAVGAIMALYHRQQTGEGQQVDVSIQEAVIQATFLVTSTWDMMKVNPQRGGGLLPRIRMRRVWPCKDGHVIWFFFGGIQAIRFNRPLTEWMVSEGMASDFLKGIDWETFDLRTVTQEILDGIEEPTGKFFLTHTKAELLEGALQRRIVLYPVFNAADVLASVQLAAREFWTEVEHPELGTTITYPGPFAKSSATPPRVSRRAPLIGEHNREILEQESGLSGEVSTTPKQSGGPVTLNKNNKQPAPRPLEGIKVVAFTWAITGARTTRTLCDYGAEVYPSRCHWPLLHREGYRPESAPPER